MTAALEREVERLRDEVSYYKQELGAARNADRCARFSYRWNLTRHEAALLDVLYARPGRLVSTDHALTALYGSGDEPCAKIISVYLCKMRRKMGDGLIETLWGQGYRLTPAGISICYALLNKAVAA